MKQVALALVGAKKGRVSIFYPSPMYVCRVSGPLPEVSYIHTTTTTKKKLPQELHNRDVR